MHRVGIALGGQSAMDGQGVEVGATRDAPRAHLVAALSGGKTGIITLDRTLTVLFTNPRLAELLAIPLPRLRVAHSLIELLEGSLWVDAATVQLIHEACVTTIDGGTQHDGRVQLRSAAGTRMLGLRVGPLADGTWLASFEDITERDAAEASAGRDRHARSAHRAAEPPPVREQGDDRAE